MKKKIFKNITLTSLFYIVISVSLFANILFFSERNGSTYATVTEVIMKNSIIWIFLGLSFLFVTWIISKNITNSIISQIDRNNPNIYEEFEPFFKALDTKEAYIKKQKKALEQKINEFAVVSNNIADGLIMLDANQKILSINKKALRTFGQKNTDYIGKHFINLTRTLEITKALDTACEGETLEQVINFNNKLYLFKISPVFRKKSIKGIVILIIDNTKKIEAEKLRREFSANVSHELRTPLTSISGYAELIKSGLVKPDDVVPFAQNIYQESQVLIKLIEDILKISKLDENETELDYEIFSLKETIENIIKRLEVQLSEKNIKINLNLENINFYGVSMIINESLYNIIQNAIKYNKQDGSLDISLFKEAKNIKIYIKDTGIGIKENAQSRVFERFYREDTSHSKTVNGTGLGLSIAKHGISFHGGKISLESTENIGTTFKITLDNTN